MEAKARVELENRHLVSRLFQRLEIDAPGYVWDTSKPPFHSVSNDLGLNVTEW